MCEKGILKCCMSIWRELKGNDGSSNLGQAAKRRF